MKATAEHARALLDKRFNTPSASQEHVVLLVDEVSVIALVLATIHCYFIEPFYKNIRLKMPKI